MTQARVANQCESRVTSQCASTLPKETPTERELLQHVLDALPFYVAILDSAFKIVAVNQWWPLFTTQNACGTAGCTVGTNYTDVLYSEIDDTSRYIAEISNGFACLSQGSVRVFTLEFRTLIGGALRWYRMNASLAGGDEGFIVVAHEDITERRAADREREERAHELEAEVLRRRKAEETARDALRAAEAANRAKSEFLARMSHELRTPLNSVIGFANVLRRNRKGTFAASEIEFLNRITTNGQHLLSLINSILDLAKVEAGHMTADLTSVALDELVKETIGELGSPQLSDNKEEEANVKLQVDLPTVVSAIITDRIKLKQMMINLLGNALKFTSRGSVTLRINTLPGTNEPCDIEVEDTGPGIPEDRLEAVFQAFEQASAETSSEFGGTGLGLAITRSFADLLGYRVEVVSKIGTGTIFRIVIRELETRSATTRPAQTAGSSTT